MQLFSGIHEVVAKRGDGKLYVGFFDDYDKAFSSVEHDPNYVAVWYGLNSLKGVPSGAALNGGFARSNRSKKDWIGRRSRLLIDVDPIREYGNASYSEKAAAHTQIVAISQYLASLGWPDPIVC